MDLHKLNFDLNDYKIFYIVASAKSFSKAAEILNVTQPSISYNIKKLESKLKTTLLERKRGGIKLTDDGEYIYNFVEYALNNFLACESQMREKNTSAETINIGVHSHIGACILPETIKTFNKEYPLVKINIFNDTSDKMKEMLVNDQLDLVILHYPIFKDLPSDIIQLLVKSYKSVFFANKKIYDMYISSKKSALNAPDTPLIMPLKGFSTSEALVKAFEKNNIKTQSALAVYSSEMMVSLVQAGVGIGWILEPVMERYNKGDLYEIPIEFKLPTTDIGIAYRKNKFSAPLSLLIQLLKS